MFLNPKRLTLGKIFYRHLLHENYHFTILYESYLTLASSLPKDHNYQKFITLLQSQVSSISEPYRVLLLASFKL